MNNQYRTHSNSSPSSDAIGQLNGPWSLLLKIFLTLMLPWGIWVTKQIIELREWKSDVSARISFYHGGQYYTPPQPGPRAQGDSE